MALQAALPDALATLKQQQAAKRTVNMNAAVKDIKAAKFFEENWNDLLYVIDCLEKP
jgi:virulence-associated protein VapD